MKTGALVALLVSSSPLATQNLLKWDQWKDDTPYTKSTLKPDRITIPTYCGANTYAICSTRRLRIIQDITVTTPGSYKLTFKGLVGGTGGYAVKITVGNSKFYDDSFEWRFIESSSIYLSAGTHRVSFDSMVDTWPHSSWEIDQPELRPVIGPEISVSGDNLQSAVGNIGARLTMRSHNAVLVAVAGAKMKAVPIPGLTHGYELQGPIVVLATNLVGGIQLNLTNAVINAGYPLAPLTFQAVSKKGFGAAITF